MAAIIPAGLKNGIKGLDANRYATKKTVAQGMLDIALLTSNASQLKYVLQVGPKHEFYTLLVVLISISIVLQASAGMLAILISFLDGHHKRKKLADWLYHTSVAMMTGVVFCDVIKMNFGLDPALSLQDYYGNITNSPYDTFLQTGHVISAVVAVVLSSIYNINHQPHQNSANILNNVSLVFKIISITVNIIISIFYSMQIDMVMKSQL